MGKIALAVGALALVLWALTVPALSWLYDDPAERGQFGDAFGAINALFSGIALGGVVFAILMQREELQLQRNELAETRAELARQAAAAEDQRRAQLLSAVITGLAARYRAQVDRSNSSERVGLGRIGDSVAQELATQLNQAIGSAVDELHNLGVKWDRDEELDNAGPAAR
ncbi:MAG: hypothetical protein NXI31_10795 [bacterium]|nr:hypothetical protein [bacterium]